MLKIEEKEVVSCEVLFFIANLDRSHEYFEAIMNKYNIIINIVKNPSEETKGSFLISIVGMYKNVDSFIKERYSSSHKDNDYLLDSIYKNSRIILKIHYIDNKTNLDYLFECSKNENLNSKIISYTKEYKEIEIDDSIHKVLSFLGRIDKNYQIEDGVNLKDQHIYHFIERIRHNVEDFTIFNYEEILPIHKIACKILEVNLKENI